MYLLSWAFIPSPLLLQASTITGKEKIIQRTKNLAQLILWTVVSDSLASVLRGSSFAVAHKFCVEFFSLFQAENSCFTMEKFTN